MNSVVRYASSIGAAALIAGCGPSTAVPGAGSTTPSSVRVPRHGAGTTVPTKLLYVSRNGSPGMVFVLTYPEGTVVQTLSGFFSPTGECVDHSGDVFVTDTEQGGAGYVFEFAHGGSAPIATLDDPFQNPLGCAVNPVNGDLALTSASGLAIFAHASGTPVKYTDPNFDHMRYDGYDPNGNLFVDGNVSSGEFRFAELPYGGSKLMDISAPQSLREAGAVQWDGQYIAVQTLSPRPIAPLIERLHVYGSNASIVGTTRLVNHNESYEGGQYWIQGGNVMGPNRNNDAVSIWKYPAGGKPKKTIMNLGSAAWGITVSIAPNASRKY